MKSIFKSRNYSEKPDEMIIRINGFDNISECETMAATIVGQIQRINRKRKLDKKSKFEYIIKKAEQKPSL